MRVKPVGVGQDPYLRGLLAGGRASGDRDGGRLLGERSRVRWRPGARGLGAGAAGADTPLGTIGRHQQGGPAEGWGELKTQSRL